jgi:hypothetical protein
LYVEIRHERVSFQGLRHTRLLQGYRMMEWCRYYVEGTSSRRVK